MHIALFFLINNENNLHINLIFVQDHVISVQNHHLIINLKDHLKNM